MRLALSLLTLFSISAMAQSKGPLRKLEQVMGALPPADRERSLDVKILLTEDVGTYTRTKLTYEPEAGRKVYAWLLVPKAGGKLPAAICLHQTTAMGKDEPIGLGQNENMQYGKELAERGWVVLAPDYPSFGDDKTDFKNEVYARAYESATMYAIVNHMRGVDLLVAHPRVDPKRIAAIGHSLGGHNALFLAAFDKRIRAAVSSCGFTSFAKYAGGDLKGWASPRYMPRIASEFENSPAKMPFEFTDVLTAIGPRGVFISAPTKDANFDASGVDDVVNAVRGRFTSGRLVVTHPDSEHDFPTIVRRLAYDFLARICQ